MNAQPEQLGYSVECCRSCPLRSEAVAAVVPLFALNQHGLSKRELQVVRLVAEGLENAEIGKRLYLAEGTIKGHLLNVHYKLDTRNRTQVAVWAIRNGLA